MQNTVQDLYIKNENMDFVKNYYNKIEIRNTKNMGRGVFAKEFIKKDSLIIIEKALALAKLD